MVIIAAQCMLIAFWGARKQNFFLDEYHSMRYAQSYTDTSPHPRYITESDLWRYNTWVPDADLREMITLEEDESVFRASFGENVRLFFSGRNYFWLLNAAESFFPYGTISAGPAFALNIIIFIVSQIIFFGILNGLDIAPRISLTAVALYGSCPLTIAMVLLTRFYAWTNCLFLIVLLLHLIMWKTVRIAPRLICEGLSALCLYLAFQNSELIFIFGGSLMIMFSVLLAVRKRWSQLAYYALPVLGAGILYVSKTTGFFYLLFHVRTNVAEAPYNVRNMSAAILELTPGAFFTRVAELLRMLGEQLFTTPLIMAAFAVLFAVVVIALFRKKGTHRSDESMWVIFVGISAVINVLFLILTNLKEERYHYMNVSVIVLVLFYVIDRGYRLRKGQAEETKRKVPLYALPVILTVLVVVVAFPLGHISYLRTEDSAMLEELEPYEGYDIAVVSDHHLNSYQAVVWGDEDSMICVVPRDPSAFTATDLPDRFLFMILDGSDFSGYDRTLSEEGYETEYLGTLNRSDVYDCYSVSE